jgi:phasin family protein
MFKNVEDFQKFNKEQLDAMTTASTTFQKGLQSIASETAAYTKKHFETSSAALEKLLGAKSLDAAFQIQTDYAKTAYESFVAQTTKFGELYTNLAKDAFKPVETAVAKVAK